jgi:hypothetical protein
VQGFWQKNGGASGAAVSMQDVKRIPYIALVTHSTVTFLL